MTFATFVERVTLESFLLFVSAAVAGVYLALLGAPSSALIITKIVVKTIPVALLAILLWLSIGGTARWLFGFALALSAVGDAILALPDDRFVSGLLAFLASHILYCAAFIRSRNRSRVEPRQAITVSVVVLVATIGFCTFLFPKIESHLVLPVAVYCLALTSMSLLAVWSGLGPLVSGGALLFVTSDSLIALDRFTSGFGGIEFLIWITYYCAQFGIAAGVLRTSLEVSSR